MAAKNILEWFFKKNLWGEKWEILLIYLKAKSEEQSEMLLACQFIQRCCWLHPGLRNWFTKFAHKDFSFIKNMLEKQEMIMKINEIFQERKISFLFCLKNIVLKNLIGLWLLCWWNEFGNKLLDGDVFWNSSSGFFKICSYVICFVILEMIAASTVIGSERKLL